MSILDRFKIVVRDSNGKVIQVHERYMENVGSLVVKEADKGYSVTITKL